MWPLSHQTIFIITQYRRFVHNFWSGAGLNTLSTLNTLNTIKKFVLILYERCTIIRHVWCVFPAPAFQFSLPGSEAPGVIVLMRNVKYQHFNISTIIIKMRIIRTLIATQAAMSMAATGIKMNSFAFSVMLLLFEKLSRCLRYSRVALNQLLMRSELFAKQNAARI